MIIIFSSKLEKKQKMLPKIRKKYASSIDLNYYGNSIHIFATVTYV